MQDAVTIRLGAYMELAITGGQTLAYLNGSAPHLIVRDGSDACRLPAGQVVPIRGQFAKIVNPFPRPVECLIGRGLPITVSPENDYLTAEKRAVVMSYRGYYLDAPTDPLLRVGMGVTMRRGAGVLWFHDAINDGQTQFVVFKGVSAALLSARPAGMMDAQNDFMTETGLTDDTLASCRGTYTATMFSDWLASAGNPVPSYHRVVSGVFSQQIVIDPQTAVFVVRPGGAAFHGCFYVRHLGLDVGDFD